MNLRPYQDQLITDIRAAYTKGHKRAVAVLPTGGGKTIVAAAIIKAALKVGTRTLFLAHREELLEQTANKLRAFDIHEFAFIKAGHPLADLSQPIQIASVQTIVRRLKNPALGAFDLLFIDEAHRVRAQSYQSVMEHFADAYAVGLTATPYRLDGKGLGGAGFTAIVDGPHVNDLIADGFLVPPRVFAPRTALDLSGIRTVAGDFNKSQVEDRMDRSKITGMIVSEWQRRAAGRPTIVYCVSVAHSIHVRAAFRSRGIRAEHVDGSTPTEQRRAILTALRDGELDAVCNCEILTEGFDAPRVGCIVLARPTKSRTLWKQMIGRGLRAEPGKSDCIILDHANCTELHGDIRDTETYSLDDRVASNRTPVVRNEETGELELRPDLIPEESDEELVEQAEPQTEPERAFRDYVAFAYEHNYQPGWALRRFRQQFGRWPRRTERDFAPYPFHYQKIDGKNVMAWVTPPPIMENLKRAKYQLDQRGCKYRVADDGRLLIESESIEMAVNFDVSVHTMKQVFANA